MNGVITCSVKEAAKLMEHLNDDDLIKQLRLFTEHQDILNIRPQGIQKIVLMRE